MVKRARSVASFVAVCLLVPGLAGEGFAGPGDEDAVQEAPRAPIDRWLVSPALSAAAAREAADRLTSYPPVFPDRDLEVAGVRWDLERIDAEAGAARVTFRPATGGGHRLLHSYLRAGRDRTVVLEWSVSACGEARLWLNGQAISPLDAAPDDARRGGRTPVRLAGGWNSLLVSIRSEGCPGELAAWLLSPRGAETDAADPSPRTQASRPPGIHRAYPAPWVMVGQRARPGPLAWPAERRELTAELALELVSWGRDPSEPLPEPAPAEEEEIQADPFDQEPDLPPDEPEPPLDEEEGEAEEDEEREEEPEREGQEEARERQRQPRPEAAEDLSPGEQVEAEWAEIRQRLAPPPPPAPPAATTVLVEGRAGGARIRTPVETPAPAQPVSFTVPLTFRELQRATAAEGVSLDVRWARERWRGTRSVDAEAVREALRRPIPLTGWVAGPEPDRRAEPARDLPARAGEWRSGRWQVPEALSNRTVELLTDGAPGRYRLDGRETAGGDGENGRGARIPLCDPCREGATLLIQAQTTGAWIERPRAVVVR